MAYDVIHKNSTVAGTPPTAGEIEVGEIAINAADAILYTKDTGGSIHEFPRKFTQTGTGAVEQSQNSKLQNIVSVLDFIPENQHAAIKAGTTTYDATTNIQAAINSGARFVSIPQGTYRITSQITLSANQAIVGDGEASTVIKHLVTGGNHLFYGQNIENSSIQGLTIEDQNNTGYSIYYRLVSPAQAYSNISLSNITLKSCSGIGAIRVESAEWVDADWQLEAEPGPGWLCWKNVQIKDISIVDFLNSSDGSSTISVTGARSCSIDNLNLLNHQERGLSVAFCTDVNVSSVRSTPVTNGNVNSNPHGVYIRTTKRITADNIVVDYGAGTGSAWGLRLSRGVYYGTFSNVTVRASNSASNFGGIGFLGGCYNSFNAASIVTPVSGLVIAPHASAVTGSGDSSFSHCFSNTFSNISSRTFGTAGTSLYGYAVGIPVGDVTPIVKNNTITNSVFENLNTNAESVAILANGQDCTISNCTFVSNSPTIATLRLTKDNRVATAAYNWTIQGCTFKDDSIEELPVILSSTNIGTPPTRTNRINGNQFDTYSKIAFQVTNGTPFEFCGNSVNAGTGVDVRTTTIQEFYISNNRIFVHDSGAGFSIYVNFFYGEFVNNTVFAIRDPSLPTVIGGNMIRSNTGVVPTYWLISNNSFHGRTASLRDLPNSANIFLNFNNIRQLFLPTIGASVQQLSNVNLNAITL